MMKWLRKKIINWLFGVDYIWYQDLFKTYNDIFDSYKDLYKSYGDLYKSYKDISDKLLNYYNKDKELNEEYVKICDYCKDIIEHFKELESELKK